MAFLSGHRKVVMAGEYDLSQFFNSVDTSIQIGTYDTTTFQDAVVGDKAFIPGLLDGAVNLQGMFEGTVDINPLSGTTITFDELMNSWAGNSTKRPLTVVHEPGTLGGSCSMAFGGLTNYDTSSPVDGVVSVTTTWQSDTASRPGRSLQAGVQTITATGNGSNVDSGIASSTRGAIGHLHMIDNTRNSGSIVVKIQHAVDSGGSPGTWADLITFSSVNALALSGQQVEVSGTVNRWFRTTVTVTGGTTGSYKFWAFVARR